MVFESESRASLFQMMKIMWRVSIPRERHNTSSRYWLELQFAELGRVYVTERVLFLVKPKPRHWSKQIKQVVYNINSFIQINHSGRRWFHAAYFTWSSSSKGPLAVNKQLIFSDREVNFEFLDLITNCKDVFFYKAFE